MAIIAASLGYIYGQRSSKLTRFFNQIDTNLKELCGPMYFSLNQILNIEDEQKREYLLDEFYKKYSSLNTNLYLMGNKKVIILFIESEALYQKFKDKRDIADWVSFWKQYCLLSKYMEIEYWSNFNSLYGEYRWFRKTLSSNIFYRLLDEFVHILYQAVQFAFALSLFAVLYSIWDYCLIKMLPPGSFAIALLVLIFVIVIYFALWVFRINVHDLRDHGDSVLSLGLIKFFPRLTKLWNSFLSPPEKEVKIPPMYKQRKL